MRTQLNLRPRLTTLGLALLATGALACSEDIDEPTQEDYDEVAQAIGPLVAQDVGAQGTIATLNASARGTSVAEFQSLAPSSRSNVGGNLEWSLDVACTDAAGIALDVCDDRTDGAVADASFDGALDLPNYQASLSASGRWTLAGLQSDEVTATGDASLVASSVFTPWWRDEVRTLDLDVDKSYELTFPVADPGAVRGTLSKSVDIRSTRTNENVDIDKRFVIDVLVELPGDRTALVTLDGTARYEVDLETGAVTRL